ncbi:MAG: hypothetical protein NE328_15510, partial [Lentisphaeraceae bacterium]|nr:hypothetical protein [Lentisphaeraceae bacterium]
MEHKVNKFLNVFLIGIIAVATALANTGYYKCHSQQTVHIYDSCCSEIRSEKTCCSTPADSYEKTMKKQCCDKVDIHLLDQQNSSSNIEIPAQSEKYFTACFSILQEIETSLEKPVLNSPTQKSPPTFNRQKTYKLNCTFIC